jgi:hypothetical protein
LPKYFLFAGLLFLFLLSCGKKNETTQDDKPKSDFFWHDNVSVKRYSDFPIKGYLDGKEVQFSYINFRTLAVLMIMCLAFSLVKPAQNCGFIEEFSGFVLINKGGSINQGDWLNQILQTMPAHTRHFLNGRTKIIRGMELRTMD